MEQENYKKELQSLKEWFVELGIYFDRDYLVEKKDRLQEEMSQPGFWDDSAEAQKTAQKMDRAKKKLAFLDDIEEQIEEVEVYLELNSEEEDSLAAEINSKIKQIKQKMEQMELKVRLHGQYDKNNALLSINPGAGGTESQDWAEMLLRMYTRWAEKENFAVETISFQPGEEAGINSVTILIKGDYSYGYLKGERGVHRLVRISPFDSSGRRHTSFASVDVLPEIDDSVEVDIDETDLKIETYRASGAGGQHVNKTESAVRITHQPTGTVVQCQNERSQHKNKKMAMKILKSRLLELKKDAKAEKVDELRGEHKEIAWGNQIRSYVLHPYNLIKDHRTDVEEGNVDKVLDGEIDQFIDAYLKKEGKNNND
ncbi:MAG: peptide chain release factor 2 [Halanaerobiaceae bacterium]